ncbi:hypothetical protein BC834DRAFT_179418 [Gloeopeniophorella convolvens]|nr:hypothetical protein BC834DRAFT_179418 [Gloeopeniophorella convolvens]
MFWVGQFETVKPPVWLWFFHDDYGIVVVLLCRFILFTVGCALMLATPPAIFLRIVFAMWPLFNLSSPEPRNIASILRLFAYIMIVQLLFMGSFLLFFKLRSLYEQHVDVVLRERLQKRWNKLHLPGAQYKSDRLDNCAGFLSLFVLWILLSFYLVWLMSSA